MLNGFLKALAAKPPDYQVAVLSYLGAGTSAHQRALSSLVETAHTDALLFDLMEVTRASLRI